MKKNIMLALFLLVVIGVSAQQKSIIDEVFIKSVEKKVASLQKSIGFDDAKAEQLKEIEYTYLQEVNKAEHCFLCNKSKRIKKLANKRDADLQVVLERDQYIKYQSIDNNLLNENNQLWLE